jgi:hypothetical protein
MYNHRDNNEYRELYADTCDVTREDTGDSVEGEVLHFKPKEFLKVIVGKAVPINLQYEPSQQMYLGGKARIHFMSNGPVRLK